MAETTSDQAALATLVEGKSDEEITNFVKEQGADTVMQPIFTGMEQHFLPDKAAGKNAVIQYDITSPDGTESWQVVIADGACKTSKGAEKEANVTLQLALPDFLRLISGKLNGVQAFMSGKLKIKGDMMMAQTMQTWFAQG
jgi:putative sterol carrier protein